MKTKTMSILAIAALSSALTGSSEEKVHRTQCDTSIRTNTWKVQVGWVHQFGRSMSVRGPKAYPSAGGRRSLYTTPGLTYPDNTALIAREFDNGYVRPDLWTADPGVPAERQGMTWNWSASAGQYNYDNGNHPTLTFTRSQGEYADGAYTTRRGGTSDDDMPTDGIEVIAKRLLHSWYSGGTSNETTERVWLDMSFIVGLAWFPAAQQRHTRAMGQNVYSLSESYTYLDYYGTQAGGSWGPLTLPYSGTYGTVGGDDAGPLIPVTPESATQLSTYMGTLNKSVNIKSKVWRLRGAAGFDFSVPLTERLSVYVAPQVVLELVDMSVDRTETTTYPGGVGSRSVSEHESKMGVYPGVLLTAGANFQLTSHWYLGASAGYEWLFVDPYVHVGPDKIEYNLSGGECSLYIGCSF